MVKSKKELKVLETFSGIGAQHLALDNLNKKLNTKYKIVGTSEWDVYAVLSYASIHYPTFEKYIKDPSFEELDLFKNSYDFSSNGKEQMKNVNVWNKEVWTTIYKAFKVSNNIGSIVQAHKRVEQYADDFNLLTYSFPCQDLSTAGNFHGFNEGIQKHTRSGLLLEIEHLLEQRNKKNKLPSYLLLENVLNLVQKQHKGSFDKWLGKLKKMGYSTIWGVIDSHKYGFVQKRRRVFALSILDTPKNLGWDKKDFIRDDLDKEIEKIFNEKYQPSWMQDIEEIIDFKNKDKHESNWAQIKDTPSRIRMIKTGANITKDTFKISTVTTKQDRLPNCGSVEYKNKREDKAGVPFTNYRFITPKESYALMGFDNEYYKKTKKILMDNAKLRNLKLDSSAREKLYKQAGNSIVVNALELIFYYLYKVGE